MRFLDALRFLTIIPLHREFSPEKIGQSMGYFPLVGLILGLGLAGMSLVLEMVLPLALVNIILIVSLVVLTGGLHLDGLVDTCDGLAVRRTPEERLDVMRDSHAGGFGVIGVCCLLLLKYISLTSVPDSARIAAIILMTVIGRWGAVYAVFAYPYARLHGLGKAFKEQLKWQHLMLATGTVVIVSAVLGRLGGILVMVGVWLIVIALASYLKKKFGGLTGDSYGAVVEVAEVGVLIIVTLVVRNLWLWSWP